MSENSPMLVVVFDDEDLEIGRFEADAVPRVGDRIEIVPRARPVGWRLWDVRAVRWILEVGGVNDGEDNQARTDVYVRVDAVEVVRTDQLPHPWDRSGL